MKDYDTEVEEMEDTLTLLEDLARRIVAIDLGGKK